MRRRGLAVVALLQLERDFLVLAQRAEASGLDCGDVHEHVLRAIIGLDEAEALGAVEKLYGAGGRHLSPPVMAWPRAIVLAAPEGEASQIVRGTGAGVVVPPEHPTAMAQAIRELYHDKAVVEGSALRALRAAPQFSREQHAHDLIHIFEQVIATPSSQTSMAFAARE